MVIAVVGVMVVMMMLVLVSPALPHGLLFNL